MIQEESLCLYKKGVVAWNAWANNMLAKKSKLEENGSWQIDDVRESGINHATNDWKSEAKVNFNSHTFKENVNFSGFIFPDEAQFVEAKFRNDANFENATFRGNVLFNRAQFCANAWLKRAEFRNNAVFDRTEFSGYARFLGAIFSGDVLFDQILFKGFADFSYTIFEKKISFIAIQAYGFFSFKKAEFHLVPDFNQAHFIEAPQLDDSDFSRAIKYKQGNDINDVNNISSKWRSLKRLAIQGHDHERELFFFAEEIKSQRGVQHKALPCPLNYLNNKPVWQGGTRYWFGLFYQWFSDFGRSVIRPLFWLLFLGVLFYIFYMKYPIENKSTQDNPITQETISCERSEAAIYLSAQSALPFLSAAGYSENIKRNYACLYGKNSDGKENIPNVAIFFNIAQLMLSTILIFLSLLALRNHFRIK